MRITRRPTQATSPAVPHRRRALWLLALGTLAAGGALTAAADAAAPPPNYSARAWMTPGDYFIGDYATGSDYRITVKNTGAATSIGAVVIRRPESGFAVVGCPSPPTGWSATTSRTQCRFTSAAPKSDDIKPGETKTFTVKAKTYNGIVDRTGSWSVVVSALNNFANPSLVKAAPATSPGLTVRLNTFQVTSAAVTGTTPALGGTCPPTTRSAPAGAVRTIVICGRNHATIPLTPAQAHSTLGGTFVGGIGTFSAASVPARSGNVVLANWTGTAVSAVPGTNKTVVATIGALAERRSPIATLPGYTVLPNPPVGTADAYATAEDTPLTVTAPGVLGNDNDPNGDPTTASNASDPAHGTVTLNADGSFTYVPDANFAGTDSFTYSVGDPFNTSPPVTVTITVNPVPDAPGAQDDTASTGEDASTAVPVLGNDTDVDGDTLSVSAVDTTGTSGLVTMGATSVTYDPNGQFEALPAGLTATDSFTYTASDGALTDTATVTVTVTGVNDAPDAVADAYDTGHNATLTVPAPGVLGNDLDVDAGATKTAGNASTPAHGTVTLQADGSFVYVPATGYSGLDSFTYDVSDGVATDSGTVTITVLPPNAVPTADAGTASAVEDAGAVPVALSGADAEGAALTFTVGTAGHGQLSAVSGTSCTSATPSACTASVDYTPDPDFFGTDTFTYTVHDGIDSSAPATVTVTVTGAPDAPGALDDTASTGEDASTAIPVLGNDTDVDGDTLSVSAVDTTGTSGLVTMGATSVTYDPNGMFEFVPAGGDATDTFTYTASDGALTDTATVTVTITGVNDAPVGVDDAYSTVADTTLQIPAPGVLSNDTDIDTGATKTAGNASTPAHGTVTLQPDGSFEYVPTAGYVGADSFTYDVSDGSATDTATVALTVLPPNATPTAADATHTILEDSAPLAIQLSGADADGDALTFDVGTATSGLVTVPASVTCDTATPSTCTATVSYTPDANTFGTDSFQYTVTDGTDVSLPATVTVNVTGVNDPPSFTKGGDQTVLEDAAAQTVPGWATAISAGPFETQNVTFTVTNDNGSLFATAPAVSSDGQLTYQPAADKYGTATVSVKAVDDGGTANGGVAESAVQTFTITVTPVNDVPVADDDTHNPTEDQLGNIDVLTGDTDADPTDVLTVGNLTNTDADGNDGVLAVNPDKTVSYDPRGKFDHLQVGQSEVDTFTYTLSDGNGGTDVGTVTVTVTGVNDNPTATPKTHSAIGNTLLLVNEPAPVPAVPHTSTTANTLLLGVTDPDDTVFTASAPATSPNGGNIAVDSTDGSFTFLPPQGHEGPESFTFTVNDAHGGSDTDTVTVTITDMVWYVDDSAPAGGTGRSTQPFNSLAPITTGGAADAKDNADDHVFVYSGTYSGTGIALETGQKLWGEPQGLTVGSTALVPAGGTNPVVSSVSGDAVTLANDTDVQRVNIASSGGVGLKGVSVTNATVGSNTTISDAVSLTGAASGTISINSTITNASSAPAVAVANRTGGAVNLPGAITDTAGGISLLNNTGATLNLTGPLSIATTTADGFVATGGGTVVAPNATNTVSTTTGRGLVVQNTTIGATDLVFRSISVNGAVSGIVLNNTGNVGNLTVTGTGANASGGLIRNTTGQAVSLTSTRDVALSHVTVQDSQNDGIAATTVTNLALTNVRVTGAGDADEERAVELTNVGGTLTIAGGLYDDAADDLVRVVNTNTNLTATVNGNATFSNQTQTNAGNAFDFVPNGTSAIAATISGNSFTNLKNTSVNFGAAQALSNGASSLTFTSNTVNGGVQGGAGVVVSGQEQTSTTTTITNNTFTGAGGNGVVNHDVNDSSTVLATILSNTFTSPKGHGIVAAVDEDGDIRIKIDGNTISNAGGDGIELVNFGDDSAAAMTSTAHFIVTNNTVNTHSLNPATQFVGGIGIFHFENDADTSCAKVTGNTVTGTPNGFFDIFLQDNSAAKMMYEESPNTAATGAVSAAYIQSKNPGTNVANIDNAGAVYSNGVLCTNP